MGGGVIGVVCPSNRPDSLARWHREWQAEFNRPDVRVFTVLDEPETWAAIEADLGETAWIIPRQTDCIRSYGFLQAWRAGADIIISLDDDCYPGEPGFLDRHAGNLSSRVIDRRWLSTIQPYTPRGYPVTDSLEHLVGINHGLWSHIPDLDAESQLALTPPYRYDAGAWKIPPGTYYPMSGMNVAFRRELVPAMWFGLMGRHLTTGEPWGYDRYGDIWAGVLSKRVCDHLGYAVRSGSPWVRHERASDPLVNREKERPGKAANEWFWQRVDAVRLTRTTAAGAYRELWAQLELPNEPYWNQVKVGGIKWAGLFSQS